MNKLKGFYKDKKVFITGHTGFKGAWLVHILNLFGAKVKGYALSSENKSLFQITSAHTICNHIEGDIRNKDLLTNELLDFEPDIIFHLAAQPLVIDSYKQPAYTFEVNQMGTIYLMDAIRALNNKCATLIITTDKVYEDNHQGVAHTEEDRLGGYDPYSASKATVELSVSSYRNSFFNPLNYKSHYKSIATARAGNVIGGGDFAKNRIIPDIIYALRNSNVVKLRNPSFIRPWQHVLDALFGYLNLTKQLFENPSDNILNSAWNFGPVEESAFTVEQLAKKAITIWGKGTCINYDHNHTDDLKETALLKLDTSKVSTILKWHQKWNADTAIETTINWYKSVYSSNKQPTQVTNDQIITYMRS